MVIVWCVNRNGSTEADGPHLDFHLCPTLRVTEAHRISTRLIVCAVRNFRPAAR
jgi:hypothetical protein